MTFEKFREKLREEAQKVPNDPVWVQKGIEFAEAVGLFVWTAEYFYDRRSPRTVLSLVRTGFDGAGDDVEDKHHVLFFAMSESTEPEVAEMGALLLKLHDAPEYMASVLANAASVMAWASKG